MLCHIQSHSIGLTVQTELTKLIIYVIKNYFRDLLDKHLKGPQMKNISLIKVTAIVITVGFASNFVYAENKVDKAIDKVQTDVAEIVEEAKQVNFPDLLKELDSDKNSKLSQTEVSADKNTILQEEFNKMDLNKDKQIDELEFNSYITEVQNKITDLAKSVN
jgi:hypothetical protein